MVEAISVDNVKMLFNLKRGKVRSIKEYLLTMADYRKTKDFCALNGISFTVDKGETFGIIGSNGAGKSTLLKVVAGIMKPTSGTVRTNGSIAPMIELGAGFDAELSAIENILLCGAILGNQKDEVEKHMVEILEFAELWDFREVPIKYYSSGMLARLAFASSSIISPDILIVDEVLSVGDYDFSKKSMKRMLDLMNGGTTVVYVSHDINSVKNLCRRAMWLERGEVIQIGEAKAVCDAYIAHENERKPVVSHP